MSDPRYLEVKIENISVFQFNFIVLLRHGGEDRVLPICIGAAEAHSIAAAYNDQKFPRPLTHDLMKNILGQLDCTVERIQVCDLKDGTFYARIFLRSAAQVLDIDSRPSDAIALALRYSAPIFVREDILRENSVHINAAESGERGESESKPAAASESKRAEPPPEPTEPHARLKHRLAKALAAERYEEAARLRDELKRLEGDN